MIIKDAPSKYESNITQKGEHLTILATAQAMNILSKSIYSRPVESCVREVSCNAYDAHVEAGIGHRPFEVTLPTYSDSTLKIKDWGNGIPPDQIRNVFATYFSSSKTESNAYTGMLGLGSKSPLAMAQQFSIEMSRDGWYYLWTIYKDSSGFPTMSDEPIIKRETADPTGITISIPVDYSKRQDVINAVNKVLPYFKTLPTIANGPQLVRKTKKVSFENCWFEDGSGAFALMGNVLYPINPEIKGLEEYKDLSSQGKLIIPFEIGELEFDASRENLQYSPQVVALLKLKFKSIVAEFASTIKSKIAAAKNAYQAVISFNEVTNHFDNKLASAIYQDMVFQGRPLKEYFPNRKATNWYKADALPPPVLGSVALAPKIGELYTLNTYRKSKFNSHLTVEPSNRIHFIYNDDGSKNLAARLWLYKDGLGGKVEPVYLNENVDINKWLSANHLTLDDLVKFSTLPKVAKSEKVGESRRRAGIFAIAGGTTKSYFWKKLDKVPESGYYFVKSDDDVLIKNEKGEEVKKHICDMHYLLRQLGLLPAELFGVSKTALKYFKDDPKFVLVEDYIRAKLLTTVNDIMKVKSYKEDNNIHQFESFWPTGKLTEELKLIKSLRDSVDKYIQAYRYFNIPYEEYKGPKLSSVELIKQFPMLEYVINNYYRLKADVVKTYIIEWAKLKGIQL